MQTSFANLEFLVTIGEDIDVFFVARTREAH